MDLSNIRAVIADDDVMKEADIRRALEFNGVRNIRKVRNQEKLWDLIYHGEDRIDLIVTDMQYPLKTGGAVDEEAGFKLIERMKNERIEIPVIVCSSLNYSIPDILGSVWYSRLNDLNLDFKKVLDKLENRSDFSIWTDGGCAPQNPGIGGYAIIIVDNAGQKERQIKQGFKRSTNNRMELRAVIRALNEIRKEASITIYTDSSYVARHFDGTYKKKSSNHDLWKLFDEAMEGRNDVKIVWVDAHNKEIKDVSHMNNNRCDAMVHEAREAELIIDEGYED